MVAKAAMRLRHDIKTTYIKSVYQTQSRQRISLSSVDLRLKIFERFPSCLLVLLFTSTSLLLGVGLSGCNADDTSGLTTSSAGLSSKDIDQNNSSNRLLCNAACQTKVDQCFIPFNPISYDDLSDLEDEGSLIDDLPAIATRCEFGSCTLPGEAEFCARVCPVGVNSAQIQCLQVASCRDLGDGRDFDQLCPAADVSDEEQPVVSCPDHDLCDGSRLLTCELKDGVLLLDAVQCEFGCLGSACLDGIDADVCAADYPRCILQDGEPFKESCKVETGAIWLDRCINGSYCVEFTDEKTGKRKARCNLPESLDDTKADDDAMAQ